MYFGEVFHLFWACFYALLGFHNSTAFIGRGVEPRRLPPKYIHAFVGQDCRVERDMNWFYFLQLHVMNVYVLLQLHHQFTAISEDSMSRAVDLARQDLKKKKLDFVSLSPTRSRSRSTTTKIVHSRAYQDKLKKRQGRHSPVGTLFLVLHCSREGDSLPLP